MRVNSCVDLCVWNQHGTNACDLRWRGLEHAPHARRLPHPYAAARYIAAYHHHTKHRLWHADAIFDRKIHYNHENITSLDFSTYTTSNFWKNIFENPTGENDYWKFDIMVFSWGSLKTRRTRRLDNNDPYLVFGFLEKAPAANDVVAPDFFSSTVTLIDPRLTPISLQIQYN